LLEPFDIFWVITELTPTKRSCTFLLTSVRIASGELTWDQLA
jgi:hypothetical protein